MPDIPKDEEEFKSWLLTLLVAGLASLFTGISSFFAAKYFNGNESDDEDRDTKIERLGEKQLDYTKEFNKMAKDLNTKINEVREKLNAKISDVEKDSNERISEAEKKGMEDYQKLKESSATNKQVIEVHRRMDTLTEKVSQCATHKDVLEMHTKQESNFNAMFEKIGALHSSVKALQNEKKKG